MKGIESGVGQRNGSNRFVRFLGALLCVLCMGLSSMAAVGAFKDEAQADPDDEYVPGELLVKFKDDVSDDDIKDSKKAVDAKELKNFKGLGIGHWKLGDDYDVEKALKEFEKNKYDDIIEFAEPNYYGCIDDFPTDPMRAEQWSMHNVGQTGGTIDADIDMLEFWNSPAESSAVVVAVIDTGVDYTHPDLDGVIWTNPGETAGNGLDDDGNGWVDDIHGYDFFNNDGDPLDDHGHGSHCAGVIAAERDNNEGVAGMSGKTKIMAVKWLNAGGSGSVTGAISAINYASSFTKDGGKLVKITSNSWKVGQKSRALEAAIKSSGALFVSSAGNSGSSQFQYPAAYSLDNIISVAATDHKDALASFSNYGSSWVDLGAPGVSVYSCYKDHGYTWMSGTSMSAPHVAGAAALVWSKSSGNTIAETKAAIMNNVESETALASITVSGGKLNIQKIFSSSSLPSDSTGPGAVSGLTVDTGIKTEYTLTLTWTSVTDDTPTGTEAAYVYDVRYLTGEITSNFDWDNAKLATLEPNPQVGGKTETFTVPRLLSGTTYTFALKVIDEAGNPGLISNLCSGTTETAIWSVYGPIGTGVGTTYKAMAYDSDGNPGIALDMGSSLQFTHRTSSGWSTPETVTNEGPGGMSMAYDGSTWVIAYGPGSLKCAKRASDGTWSTTMIERNNVGYDAKGIAVSNGVIGISYRKGGLMYAEYKGGVWTKYLVDRGAACRYSAIEFDSSGQPAIAYCHYTGDNGNMLDIQKYATRSSDGTWTIETVASGVIGYGVLCDLEVDGTTPYIVSSGYQSGGSGWSFHFFTLDAQGDWATTDVGTSAGSETSIAVDYTTDTPYIAYTDLTDRSIYVSKGALSDGDWSFTREMVDPGMEANFNTILEFYYHTDGTTTTQKLGHCYGAYAGVSPAPRTSGITFAERDLTNPSAWG